MPDFSAVTTQFIYNLQIPLAKRENTGILIANNTLIYFAIKVAYTHYMISTIARDWCEVCFCSVEKGAVKQFCWVKPLKTGENVLSILSAKMCKPPKHMGPRVQRTLEIKNEQIGKHPWSKLFSPDCHNFNPLRQLTVFEETSKSSIVNLGLNKPHVANTYIQS